jgi:hypothetical protein
VTHALIRVVAHHDVRACARIQALDVLVARARYNHDVLECSLEIAQRTKANRRAVGKMLQQLGGSEAPRRAGGEQDAADHSARPGWVGPARLSVQPIGCEPPRGGVR